MIGAGAVQLQVDNIMTARIILTTQAKMLLMYLSSLSG